MLHLLPYAVILVANFLYIYAYSYDPEEHQVQIFLFNFGIMLLVGIFAIIKVNLMLHQWLVVEQEKNSSGKPNMKGVMKKKIQ